jgi:hypothetical protein
LIPELSDHQTDANLFHRTVTSPFLDRRIVQALAAYRRNVLVVSGYSTEAAVLQSTFDALEGTPPVKAALSRSDEAVMLRS